MLYKVKLSKKKQKLVELFQSLILSKVQFNNFEAISRSLTALIMDQ